MGSYCSCPNKETVSDNHQNKFRFTNVHGDGNELGSARTELTDTELTLYTCKGDSVIGHYLSFCRHVYDSNIFPLEKSECGKLDKESLPLNVAVLKSYSIGCKK